MAQYMISVWHEDEYELNFTGPDAQRQIAQVEGFTQISLTLTPSYSPPDCSPDPLPRCCVPKVGR